MEEMKADKEQRLAKMKANHEGMITLAKNGWWPGCICFRLRVRRRRNTSALLSSEEDGNINFPKVVFSS
jgi:hypothetical protein